LELSLDCKVLYYQETNPSKVANILNTFRNLKAKETPQPRTLPGKPPYGGEAGSLESAPPKRPGEPLGPHPLGPVGPRPLALGAGAPRVQGPRGRGGAGSRVAPLE